LGQYKSANGTHDDPTWLAFAGPLAVRALCYCLYWALILPTCRYTFPVPVVSLAPAAFFSAPYNEIMRAPQKKHTEVSERYIDTSAKW